MRTNRLTTFSVAALMACFLALPLSAQPDRQQLPQNLSKRLSPQEQIEKMEQLRQKYPLFTSTKSLSRPQTTLQQSHKPGTPVPLTRRPNSGAKRAASNGTIIWANVNFMYSWNGEYQYGYYSFTPSATITPERMHEDVMEDIIAQRGVQLKGTKLYCCWADLTYGEYGSSYVYPYRYVYDTTTWEMDESESQYFTDYDCSFIAQETAQAADGTVYGEFYKSDLSGFEWGTVDYSTETRTTIGDATHKFVALGITSKNQLYGVASDGNLYSISLTDGTETLIGATGLTLTVSSGTTASVYAQTGEIDQRTDVFYWAAVDATGGTGLYTVDLTTGKATKVGDFDCQTSMVGMIIPQDIALPDAPAQAQNLAVNFSGTSLSGTVSFTAPSTTYGGTALSGDLTYTVMAGGETLATGTTTPGAAVQAQVTLPQSGSYDFIVTTSNAAGVSPRATLNAWVGHEAPNPPTSATMMVGNNYAITVFWTAPTTTVNGNAIGQLSYDVYRCTTKDRVKVASDLATNVFTETLENPDLTEYHYEIYAKNYDALSEVASTASQIFGESIKPDYFEDFTSSTAENLFTKIDVNSDGKTWGHDATNHCMRTYYSDEKTGSADNDWLITPKIHLTTDRTYTISFSAKNRYPKYPNNLEVKWGMGNTPASLTNTLLATTALSGEYTKYSYVVTPTVEGDYYIGFHDTAPSADYGVLNVDSIAVKANALLIAPAAPKDLKAVAGAKGAQTATITFTVPSTDVKGNAISTVEKVEIRRNAQTIKTYGETKAGTVITFEDTDIPDEGLNAYEAAAYAGGECGDWAVTTVWIGFDTPGNPTNVQLKDNVTNLLTSWDPYSEVGVNGGYVATEDVEVSVYGIDYDGYQMYLGSQLAISDPGATSVELEIDPEVSVSSDGKQSLVSVAAHTEGRDATMSDNYVFSSSVIVGPSVQIPFAESFANGYVDNGLCWTENNDAVNNRSNASQWSTSTWAASDNDGGCVQWTGYATTEVTYSIQAGDESAFCLAKASLKGASKPKLTFDCSATAGTNALMQVIMLLPDGTEKTVETIDLSQETKSGWKTYSVDLSAFKNERYVICKFNGVAKASGISISVDNVNIIDDTDYNLAATSLTVPDNVKTGRPSKVSVGVKNLGTKEVSGYSVALYLNNKKVSETAVNGTLASMKETTVDLSLTVPVSQKGNATVKAEVIYSLDTKADDNFTQTKTISVTPVRTATVDDLVADEGTTSVALTWTKPETLAAESITESFEDYSDWAYAFGDWATIDGNTNAEAVGLYTGYNSPFSGKSFAYTVFNAQTVVEDFDASQEQPGLCAHTGDKYAAVPYEWDNSTSAYADGDNWLISPVLSGNGQTISFWVNNVQIDNTLVNNETFDFLISMTDDQQSSFTKIGTTYSADGQNLSTAGSNWKQVSVFVPQGTKYFAIHQNTPADNAYLFGVDDLTFEAGDECADYTLTGYNIYRDGELVGTVNGSTLTYNDNVDDFNHYYNVTVLYTDSEGNVVESPFSNTALTATSIDDIEALTPESVYNVYTLDGKAVRLNANTLKGLQRGVYVVNDRKFVVK